MKSIHELKSVGNIEPESDLFIHFLHGLDVAFDNVKCDLSI